MIEGDGTSNEGPGKTNVLTQQLLTQLLKACPHPVLVIRPDSEIILINKGALRFLDIKENFPRKSLEEYLPNESAEILKETISDIKHHGLVHKECMLGIDVTGTRYGVSIIRMGFAESPRTDVVEAYLLMFRTNPSEALDPHNIRMATIGEFSAGIAHELNTPLANISLIAENLIEDSTDEEKVKELNKILAQVEVSARIVKELLAFSRKGRPTFENVDLNTIVQEAMENIIMHDGYNVVLELEDNLPTVKADMYQIQEIIINLVQNAQDSMKDGGDIILRTRSRGAWVEIDVQDSGEGVSEDNINEIFRPFFTTKPHGQGIGLGLAICQRIVTNHKGKINISSESGKGSIFTVSLPRGS